MEHHFSVLKRLRQENKEPKTSLTQCGGDLSSKDRVTNQTNKQKIMLRAGIKEEAVFPENIAYLNETKFNEAPLSHWL